MELNMATYPFSAGHTRHNLLFFRVVKMVDFVPDYYYEEIEAVEDEFNPSLTTVPRQKNYWAVILGLLCILVVIGNVLVIVSVFKEKVLQNITNYFIVSLAVADLLVAGCVMPFSVYVLVRKNSKFGQISMY